MHVLYCLYRGLDLLVSESVIHLEAPVVSLVSRPRRVQQHVNEALEMINYYFE